MLFDNSLVFYLKLSTSILEHFRNAILECGNASRSRKVSTMTRDVQTPLSARDILPGYFSCLLHETLLHSRFLAASSSRSESHDGTINASTNGIHRHDFSRHVFRLFLVLSVFQLYHPSRLLSSSFSNCLCLPLSVIPRYLPHCLFHLDAPLRSLHYIPLLDTVTYP